jgi:hypothetical protein
MAILKYEWTHCVVSGVEPPEHLIPSYWRVDTQAEADVVESGMIPCEYGPAKHSYPGDFVMVNANDTLYRIDSHHKLKKV